MSLIVEFELETPILRVASGAIDRIRFEEVYETESGESKLLFCAFGEGSISSNPHSRTIRPFGSLPASRRHWIGACTALSSPRRRRDD